MRLILFKTDALWLIPIGKLLAQYKTFHRFCELFIGGNVTIKGERHTILSIMPRHVTMVNSQEKRIYVGY